MAQKQLFIFGGPPGAGKTTVAQWIEELTGAEHIWTDKERQEMFGKTYNPGDSDKLYRILNQRAADLLAAGKSVIYDTNFNYYKDRELMRQLASEHGAELKLVFMTTPVEIAKHRALSETVSASRQYTEMNEADFERIMGHCEWPLPAENAIMLDGTDLCKDDIARAVQL